MLIKNPGYCPGNLAETLLEDGEVLEREWRDNVATKWFYPLQIPRSRHKPSTVAKTVRDNFKDYFMNERVVDMEILLETFLIIHGLVVQL